MNENIKRAFDIVAQAARKVKEDGQTHDVIKQSLYIIKNELLKKYIEEDKNQDEKKENENG